MTPTDRVVIQGRPIDLADDVAPAARQEVEIALRSVAAGDARTEAILRTAGSMADDPEFAEIMNEVEHHRHVGRSRDLSA